MANIRTRIKAVPTLIEPIFLLNKLFISGDFSICMYAIYNYLAGYLIKMFDNIGLYFFNSTM